MKKLNLSWRNFWGIMFVLGSIVLVLALVGTSPRSTKADEPRGDEQRGPKVIPPEYVAFGRTYGEWSAAWWQWAFSIPVASHPLFDNGDCSTGRSGPVWFLGEKFCMPSSPAGCSGTVTRSCSVPASKALFFCIVGDEDSAPEEVHGLGCGNLPPLLQGTIAELYQCAQSYEFLGATGLSAEIDGELG